MTSRGATLGLAEAARKLRVPYRQAHRLVLVGLLSGKKVAGRWLVTHASVRRLTKALVVRSVAKTRQREA